MHIRIRQDYPKLKVTLIYPSESLEAANQNRLTASRSIPMPTATKSDLDGGWDTSIRQFDSRPAALGARLLGASLQARALDEKPNTPDSVTFSLQLLLSNQKEKDRQRL